MGTNHISLAVMAARVGGHSGLSLLVENRVVVTIAAQVQVRDGGEPDSNKATAH